MEMYFFVRRVALNNARLLELQTIFQRTSIMKWKKKENKSCTAQFPPVINFKIPVNFSNIKKVVELFVKNECKRLKRVFITEKCICEVTNKLMVLNRHW
jgi:hypothetical protein